MVTTGALESSERRFDRVAELEVVFVAEGMKAMVEMGMFLGILSVGILYGWREGILKWQ